MEFPQKTSAFDALKPPFSSNNKKYVYNIYIFFSIIYYCIGATRSRRSSLRKLRLLLERSEAEGAGCKRSEKRGNSVGGSRRSLRLSLHFIPKKIEILFNKYIKHTIVLSNIINYNFHIPSEYSTSVPLRHIP